jgi:hypothetical protein
MHGPPEEVGLALIEGLSYAPIEGWDRVVANEEAVAAGLRYIKHNLATSFDRANPTSMDYELRRAHQLLEMAAGCGLVLDVHDAPNDSRGDFVGLGLHGDPRCLGVAALLGTQNVMVVKHRKSITGYNPKAIFAEMGRGRNGELVDENVARLYNCMGVAASRGLPEVDTRDFNYYDLVTEISTERANELGIPNRDLAPFEPMPADILSLIRPDITDWRKDGEYVVDYWNGQSSSPDWFGGVFRRIPNPYLNTRFRA